MYKKLIAPVAIAVVATVGLVGGTVSAQEVSAPVFDENGNSAVIEVTCENITLSVQHNRTNRQGTWLRSFYMGGPLPANGSVADLTDPQLIDVMQGTVGIRNIASADVVVSYFSGDRDLPPNPGTWKATGGWTTVETTVVNLAENCPVVEETTVPAAVETSAPQVTQVPVGPVNAGGSNAIVASFVAFIGSLVGLGYGVARLRKTN